MFHLRLAFLALFLFVGCKPKDEAATQPGGGPPRVDLPNPTAGGTTLPEARKGFVTKHKMYKTNERVDEPPAKIFRTVKYDSAVGKLAAYLTPNPGDGKKHPAIIWITGGDCNTIGDVWSPRSRSDDQSARQYREAGIVMMFPSLRGGNENPGFQEGFFGEVDDVIAAADFIAKQDYVDPNRIYLGGHSTGGTLVLLVAESTDKFRAVFSFGPVHDIRGYGGQFSPFDTQNAREFELRAPIRWLHGIKSPTFVFEGTSAPNLIAMQAMKDVSTNPAVHFFPVSGATHFSTLAPLNRLIARKILADDGATANIAFTHDDVNREMKR